MSPVLLAEHPFPTVDLGVTTYGDRPPIVKALAAVERGIGFGYPLCCVEEFAVDVLEGRLPALRRGSVETGVGGRYVPCSGCCEEMGRTVLTNEEDPMNQPQQSRIYVASSWRCSRQPNVVAALRLDGHEVYDFRAPKGPGSHGFSWHELDPSIPRGPADLDLPAHKIREMLAHPISEAGFASDMGALRACDICVLVLPCGRSAHLEAGWAAGAGKHVVVLLEDGEPDLMWKLGHRLCVSIDEVRAECIGYGLEAAA